MITLALLHTWMNSAMHFSRLSSIIFVCVIKYSLEIEIMFKAAKYDKANNINKMKENIVEMVLLELKPQQRFHHQYTFSFISIYFPSIWSFGSCLGTRVCMCGIFYWLQFKVTKYKDINKIMNFLCNINHFMIPNEFWDDKLFLYVCLTTKSKWHKMILVLS